MQKMNVRWILIYRANLATFEESLIFGRPKRLLSTPTAPKHDMKFYAYHFFSTLRNFYVKMAIFEGGVYISLVGKQRPLIKNS